jgi:hypothetical protein
MVVKAVRQAADALASIDPTGFGPPRPGDRAKTKAFVPDFSASQEP